MQIEQRSDEFVIPGDKRTGDWIIAIPVAQKAPVFIEFCQQVLPVVNQELDYRLRRVPKFVSFESSLWTEGKKVGHLPVESYGRGAIVYDCTTNVVKACTIRLSERTIATEGSDNWPFKAIQTILHEVAELFYYRQSRPNADALRVAVGDERYYGSEHEQVADYRAARWLDIGLADYSVSIQEDASGFRTTVFTPR